MPSKTVNGRITAHIRERDEMVCQICDKPCDPDAPPGHDEYPTVDHIIPLSKGGAFTNYKNLQLAHNKCNTDKGNTMPNVEYTGHVYRSINGVNGRVAYSVGEVTSVCYCGLPSTDPIHELVPV